MLNHLTLISPCNMVSEFLKENLISLWGGLFSLLRLQSFHEHVSGFNFNIMNTLHEFAPIPM